MVVERCLVSMAFCHKSLRVSFSPSKTCYSRPVLCRVIAPRPHTSLSVLQFSPSIRSSLGPQPTHRTNLNPGPHLLQILLHRHPLLPPGAQAHQPAPLLGLCRHLQINIPFRHPNHYRYHQFFTTTSCSFIILPLQHPQHLDPLPRLAQRHHHPR